ncbi:MAG: hypothetical protein R2688_01815 [Fimbriimonadaceae bacterium]
MNPDFHHPKKAHCKSNTITPHTPEQKKAMITTLFFFLLVTGGSQVTRLTDIQNNVEDVYWNQGDWLALSRSRDALRVENSAKQVLWQSKVTERPGQVILPWVFEKSTESKGALVARNLISGNAALLSESSRAISNHSMIGEFEKSRLTLWTKGKADDHLGKSSQHELKGAIGVPFVGKFGNLFAFIAEPQTPLTSYDVLLNSGFGPERLRHSAKQGIHIANIDPSGEVYGAIFEWDNWESPSSWAYNGAFLVGGSVVELPRKAAVFSTTKEPELIAAGTPLNKFDYTRVLARLSDGNYLVQSVVIDDKGSLSERRYWVIKNKEVKEIVGVANSNWWDIDTNRSQLLFRKQVNETKYEWYLYEHK